MTWPKGVVIFSGMRSGSNYLEEGIAQWSGFRSYGEVFNPSFIGHPDAPSAPNLTLEDRRAAPESVCDTLASGATIPILRWFDGHNRRAQLHMISDPNWAKIRLTRSVLDRYASLKLAQMSGQWRVRTRKDRKRHKITFKEQDFQDFCSEERAANFQLELLLKRQECFRIDYIDLHKRRMWKWLANWLGVARPFTQPRPQLIRQNPGPAAAKFLNPTEIPDNAYLSRAVPPSKVVFSKTSNDVYFNLEPDTYATALRSAGGHGLQVLTGDSAKIWKSFSPNYTSIAVIEDPVKRAARLWGGEICNDRAFVKALRHIKHTPRPLRPIEWQPQLWQIPVSDRWSHETELRKTFDIPICSTLTNSSQKYMGLTHDIWPEDYDAFGLASISQTKIT
jgi:hypothetical protein